MSAASPKRSGRANLLSRIHIAKKDLALVDDSYRAILKRIAGHDSAAKISDAGLIKVLREFTRLGHKPRRPTSEKPHVRKVFAVWTSMRALVTNPSRDALRAFVLRQTGVADPEWLSADQANKVIEGLKAWRTRAQAARRAAGGGDADT